MSVATDDGSDVADADEDLPEEADRVPKAVKDEVIEEHQEARKAAERERIEEEQEQDEQRQEAAAEIVNPDNHRDEPHEGGGA